MLVAVAAASPSTTSLPLTKPWANIPVSMVRRYNTPVILALRRGDVSPNRSVNRAVLIFVSPYLRNGAQSASDSDRSLIAAQPDRGGEECRGNGKANPQTWTAQESTRRDMYHGTGWEHVSHGDGLRVA